ncbi:34-kDa subunit of RNA polymerase III (C) [Actinomortierella wolfii]|nr:34-kDa subunit of RNA polymerase III (C) [Actinomortierella wolfii]KAG0224692.1 34-kDa subunit of RNA polymerase III (C) [Actinomortierella wolfii]
MSDMEELIYQATLKAGDHGLTTEDLQKEHPEISLENIADTLNVLSHKKLISFFNVRGILVYKAVKKEEASKLGSLEGDEQLIYQHIKASGNEGIWTKHLKAKTNLHQNIIMRCLKTLEQKSLVKSIKSVKNPTRKLYMLMELTPSIEVTGGPWFTDQELDVDFVEQLTNQCYKFILMKSFPRDPSAIFTAEHTSYPTAAAVRRYIVDKRISQVDLTVEDITMLLDVLVYDGKIERFLSAVDEDWEDDEGSTDWVYKAVRTKSAESAWQDCPCGVCPVADFCTENGPINPANCAYYTKWLDF